MPANKLCTICHGLVRKVAALTLVLTGSAFAQSASKADSNSTSRSKGPSAQVVQLIGVAHELEPEYAADILLRLAERPGLIESSTKRQELLEEVFALAAGVEHHYSQFYVGAGPGYLGSSREVMLGHVYDLGLDTLSLQTVVMKLMLTSNPTKAIELLQLIRTPLPEAATCESTLVDDVHRFYPALEMAARLGFSAEERRKGRHVDLIASQLRSIRSGRDLATAARILLIPGLNDEEFEYLTALFCDRLVNAEYDVFLCSLDDNVTSRKLLARAQPLGKATDLVLAYRTYLSKRFGAERCSGQRAFCGMFDHMLIPDAVEEFNEKFRNFAQIPVSPISMEQLSKFAVRPEPSMPSMDEALSTAPKLDERISRLVFGSGQTFNDSGLSDEQKQDPVWQAEAEQILAEIDGWQAGSPASFHRKCGLYQSLLRACPSGRLKDRVLARQVDFLSGHSMERAHPVEWLSWVKDELGLGFPRSQVLDLWRRSGDHVLAAYAALEELTHPS